MRRLGQSRRQFVVRSLHPSAFPSAQCVHQCSDPRVLRPSTYPTVTLDTSKVLGGKRSIVARM